jgi:hypothetical protein
LILKDRSSVYTFISYALFDDAIHQYFIEEVNVSQYSERIAVSTDNFLTEQEQPEKETYSNFKKAAI